MAERDVPAAPTAAGASPNGSDQPTELERLAGWLDERTGLGATTRVALRKVFPDHWSFLLGEIALFCFVVLLATGIFMTFFYTPDARQIVYEGSYAPLVGTPVSAAYESVVHLSLDVRAGLLMRQVHHWAALIFVVLGTIALQLIANALMLDRQRRTQERAQELLHVQKWQLQQLVPSSGSSS